MVRFSKLLPLIVGALLAGVTSLAPARARGAPAVAQEGRARINFNADWRFMRGTGQDGQRHDLDDAGWEQVGLAHSFSMPYFRAAHFYTGDGWYRKTITLSQAPAHRRLLLEFEGAFQDARVYVSSVEVGHHRGGYTGFAVDISKAVRPGHNLIAVRVNNDWQATLAPRAGDVLALVGWLGRRAGASSRLSTAGMVSRAFILVEGAGNRTRRRRFVAHLWARTTSAADLHGGRSLADMLYI